MTAPTLAHRLEARLLGAVHENREQTSHHETCQAEQGARLGRNCERQRDQWSVGCWQTLWTLPDNMVGLFGAIALTVRAVLGPGVVWRTSRYRAGGGWLKCRLRAPVDTRPRSQLKQDSRWTHWGTLHCVVVASWQSRWPGLPSVQHRIGARRTARAQSSWTVIDWRSSTAVTFYTASQVGQTRVCLIRRIELATLLATCRPEHKQFAAIWP